jgi:hypothetical protein
MRVIIHAVNDCCPSCADIVINTLFTMEMLIRMGALGAPWVISYLKEPWNLFDFFMVREAFE